MIDIERPQVGVEFVSDDEKYGKFTVEPLERGYGITLGNSLRRIMLSSLPGVAVQSIKIDGVSHEFSTIPGVKEDVTEIILNIKGLIAKLYSDGPKVVYIEATGEQEVTAADIKTDSDVEILNPGPAYRKPRQGRLPLYEHYPQQGQGLCAGRPQQAVFERNYRGDPRRFHLHAGGEGQLLGGQYARRSDHRL